MAAQSRREAYRKLLGQQVDDAGLGDRGRPHRGDGVGQAGQAVADHDAHIGHTAVLDLGKHPQPVLGTLTVAVLAGPQAQDVPLAIHGHAQGDVDGPVGDVAVADLDVDGVDEQHRVDRVQRPGLPGGQALQHPVGDGGDGLPRHVGAVDLGQVRLHLPGGQPLGDQRHHQVLHAPKALLALAHDLWLEGAVAVAGHREFH
jgi:hypothetical protein